MCGASYEEIDERRLLLYTLVSSTLAAQLARGSDQEAHSHLESIPGSDRTEGKRGSRPSGGATIKPAGTRSRRS